MRSYSKMYLHILVAHNHICKDVPKAVIGWTGCAVVAFYMVRKGRWALHNIMIFFPSRSLTTCYYSLLRYRKKARRPPALVSPLTYIPTMRCANCMKVFLVLKMPHYVATTKQNGAQMALTVQTAWWITEVRRDSMLFLATEISPYGTKIAVLFFFLTKSLSNWRPAHNPNSNDRRSRHGSVSQFHCI